MIPCKMAASTCQHAVYPDSQITMVLFRDVKNSAELRQCVMKGEFEASLLKTTVIVDPFQVLVAANKAVHLQRCGKMMTRNVHTEVLFNLSPSKNISDSFKKFGLGENDSSVYVVLINDADRSQLDSVRQKIQGRMVDVSEVKELTDHSVVKKVYKLTEEELNICSPVDAIVTRIAAKELAVL